MDFSNYKFRCHYQGSLVSVPKPLTINQSETLNSYRDRIFLGEKPLTIKQKADWHSLEHKLNESKKYSLTDTAKKICSKIVFYEKYKREFRLDLKQYCKGLEVEKAGRDLVSGVLGQLLVSDDERRTNEWVTGKRDIKHDCLSIDIKNAYDFESFNNHLLESTNEFYFRQQDSYMELWGIEDSLLAFTLVDTPFKLVNDELRRLDFKSNIMTIEGDIIDAKIEEVVNLVQNHIFTRKGLEEYCQLSSQVHIEWFDNFIEIPKKERVHLVPHKFDKVRIEQRNECLSLCREFMKNITPINNLKF